MKDFTKEELESAHATKDTIIKTNVDELKAVYMAGEICMWDEMQDEIKKTQA